MAKDKDNTSCFSWAPNPQIGQPHIPYSISPSPCIRCLSFIHLLVYSLTHSLIHIYLFTHSLILLCTEQWYCPSKKLSQHLWHILYSVPRAMESWNLQCSCPWGVSSLVIEWRAVCHMHQGGYKAVKVYDADNGEQKTVCWGSRVTQEGFWSSPHG